VFDVEDYTREVPVCACVSVCLPVFFLSACHFVSVRVCVQFKIEWRGHKLELVTTCAAGSE